jgi:hypothetical protein
MFAGPFDSASLRLSSRGEVVMYIYYTFGETKLKYRLLWFTTCCEFPTPKEPNVDPTYAFRDALMPKVILNSKFLARDQISTFLRSIRRK